MYLKSCISYAYNILVVSDGIDSINLGGLQADLKGGGSGGAEPPQWIGINLSFPSAGPVSVWTHFVWGSCLRYDLEFTGTNAKSGNYVRMTVEQSDCVVNTFFSCCSVKMYPPSQGIRARVVPLCRASNVYLSIFNRVDVGCCTSALLLHEQPFARCGRTHTHTHRAYAGWSRIGNVFRDGQYRSQTEWQQIAPQIMGAIVRLRPS